MTYRNTIQREVNARAYELDNFIHINDAINYPLRDHSFPQWLSAIAGSYNKTKQQVLLDCHQYRHSMAFQNNKTRRLPPQPNRKDMTMTHTDLTNNKSLAQLTELYNQLVPSDQQVKKFRDKPTAIERLTRLMAGRTPEDAPLPTDEQKESFRKKVKSPRATDDSEEVAGELVTGGHIYDLDLKVSSKVNIATEEQPSKPSRKPITIVGKKSQYAAKRIHVVSSNNPRKPGTEGWHNFNIYKEGMTYHEFILQKGGSNHLRWDIEHGYVQMVD